MEINEQMVDKLAKLAKLEFDLESKKDIMKDLTQMLAFVEKLKELDVSGLEPLIYMTDEVNHLRTDEVRHEITQEEALRNAPKKDSDYFKVPKVIKK